MTPKPPTRKGGLTRARIVDSAFELFAESGFTSVSIREIAAHAHISHVGLLHHFGSKDELLLEVLRRRDSSDIAELRDGAHGIEVLEWALHVIHDNVSRPGIVSLFVKVSSEATDPDHPAHEFFANRYALLAESAGRAFAELFEDSPPPIAIEPLEAARQFIALADGLQLQWMLSPHRVTTYDSLVVFLRTLGITPRPVPSFPEHRLVAVAGHPERTPIQ
ncbi:TetR/AcrR family transcriptional regulator [Mycetocola tolaasinivorans]|uniref:TetR/AcrR family transcriptional regulator n=1 Tax=Mycetocola tolaasinivorans TaxID=76635 RepID=A0A3L7ACF6_9MICO|nr:TetR/AcrR family transcriptional regulator [Mycetocola tolaasinivorans]RLP77907.1 TetR/AcrR family transcriptional regulator [Mycetocola tolaasinivorans]